MSNTVVRIISALVLLVIVCCALYLGRAYSLALLGCIGLLVIDELVVNFIQVKRRSFSYAFSILTFFVAFSYFNYVDFSFQYLKAFNNLGVLESLVLLLFLFREQSLSGKVIYKIFNQHAYLIGFLIFIPFMNLAAIMHLNHWIYLFVGLFILNFGVDTGAWFWGKNFGRHKLWPSVSPKKTVEGFAGGVITSVLITSIYWSAFVGKTNYKMYTSFFIIACCSQLGDLVQSKLKRSFNIKDSSNLIPGHGGVYDRVDSLLFVSPLYLWLVS